MLFKKNTKVGIIGYGKMGKLHARGYLNCGCKIVGIFDNYIYCENILKFKSIKDLAKNVDIISVCSPSSTHYDILKEIIPFKKAIIVEKPMVSNQKQCESIVNLCKKYKPYISIGHIERFNCVFQDFLKYLPEIGCIKKIKSVRINPCSNTVSYTHLTLPTICSV